jgi:RNA polymerase sigma factor (sigma-70 family)
MAIAAKKLKKLPVDNTLVRRIKATGCNESFLILLDRHEKLFYKMCQIYAPVAEAKGFRRQDMFQEKSFVLFKAVRSYKPNKNTKFSTWFGNCSKYFCLTFINSRNRFVDLEDETIETIMINKSKEEFDDESNLKNDKEYVFKLLKQLKDKRISKVFKLRYFDKDIKNKKATWSTIASKINTSTQTAINLHQKGVRMLHKKMNSNEHQDNI